MVNEIIIEQVSYEKENDLRIIKSCLEKWFQNPKDLNLTAPNMKYPFNFNKWIADSYALANTHSYVLKKNNWIIGYASLQLKHSTDFVHLFHVFIDREYRGKGYSKFLLEYAIEYAKENYIPAITLYVLPNNEPAINLYKSYGFVESGQFSSAGSPRLRLQLI